MKTSFQEKKTEYSIIFYLLLISLLAHGLALLNNGIYWDGALLYGFYQDNNIEQLHLITFSMGLPSIYYIHHALWGLGYSFICNIIGVASIYIVALFGYKSTRLFHSANKSTAILVATFIILYPGSMITFYHATIHYYISCALFAAAFYLGLKQTISDNVGH